MKKMTREELIDFMVEDELDMMSMEDLAYNFEYAMKHGTRGYSEYSNEELESAYALAMDEEVQIVEVREFDNALGVAKYIFDELSVNDLIALLDVTIIHDRGVNTSLLEMLLDRHDRVKRGNGRKYQFIYDTRCRK